MRCVSHISGDYPSVQTLDGMVMDQKGEKRKKELGKMVKELRESYEKWVYHFGLVSPLLN